MDRTEYSSVQNTKDSTEATPAMWLRLVILYICAITYHKGANESSLYALLNSADSAQGLDMSWTVTGIAFQVAGPE